jgi:hypothetical protein
MSHLDEGTLQAWLDGARSGLDPSKLASIERHVRGCDACTSRADALARSSFRTHALLSVGRDQYAPRVPYEDVAKRARGTRTRVRSRVRRIQVTWAASILCAIGLGWISNELYHANDAIGAEAGTGALATAPSTQPENGLAETSSADAASPTPESAGSAFPGPSLAAAGTSLRLSPPSSSIFASQTPRMSGDFLVRGFVGDEGGRPVPSAQVYVAALDVAVLTRDDGRFDLRLPTGPESYEITVQRIGFRQQTRAINGSDLDDVSANFRLREEALALDEIIVTGESDGARSTGTRVTNVRAAPFVWRPSPSIAAEGHVGSALWMLPGLDLLSLEVAYGGYPNETHVARVRLDLGEGKILTLVQGRTDGRRIRWPIQSQGAVLSTRRGEMLITATAAVSADSLRALLEQLR